MVKKTAVKNPKNQTKTKTNKTPKNRKNPNSKQRKTHKNYVDGKVAWQLLPKMKYFSIISVRLEKKYFNMQSEHWDFVVKKGFFTFCIILIFRHIEIKIL